MAVIVIPIAICVHTVVSWVFAMTVQPMWHSTIFGPYFVVGAIFSGIAAIIIAMAIIRKAYHLEDVPEADPLQQPRAPAPRLHAPLVLLHLRRVPHHLLRRASRRTWRSSCRRPRGSSRPSSGPWSSRCFVIPFTLLANNRTRRTVWGCVVASISVEIGMWLERFLIVVPSLSNPRLPLHRRFLHRRRGSSGRSSPRSSAMFILLYAVFTKLFPIVSIWEIREGREHVGRRGHERVESYLPGTRGGAP